MCSGFGKWGHSLYFFHYSDFYAKVPPEEWMRVRGPYRRPGQSIHHSNGRRYESFSSSTDPSIYRNNSMEDTFDDDDVDSGSRTPVAGILDSKAAILARQPSLVDELLSEIYARFGNGLTSRTFDSSQRASASGSQVDKSLYFRPLKGTSCCWSFQ